MKNCLFLVLLLSAVSAQAQHPVRLFLDVPGIYAHSPKLDAIVNNAGLGLDAGFGVGTHYVMSRFSGGTTVTADFEAEAIEKTVVWNPFLRLEAGAGLWRSNGNQCSEHHANAYTALGKAGVQYAFQPKEIQYTVGVELSYFYIRDYFKNLEIFLDGGLNMTTNQLYASFGFRNFLNMRA